MYVLLPQHVFFQTTGKNMTKTHLNTLGPGVYFSSFMEKMLGAAISFL